MTPALLRYALSGAGDEPTLRAMGWTRRERAATGVATAAAAGVVAVVVVGAIVVASSALTPIGNGRRIEPRLRIVFDAPVVVVASLAAVFVALTIAVAAAHFAPTRPRAVRDDRPS